MILKRLLGSALGAFAVALGVIGLGALASGPAFANEIPAPDSLNDLTGCITGNTPAPRGAPPRFPVSPPTDFADPYLSGFGIRSLYSVGDCEDIKLDSDTAAGDGVNLKTLIERARTAYGSLPDSDDDDYASELAAFEARYSGAIFKAVTAEIDARADAQDALGDFNDAKDVLHTNVTDDGYSAAISGLYRGLQVEVDATAGSTSNATPDTINLPGITGVTFDNNGVFTGASNVTTSVSGANVAAGNRPTLAAYDSNSNGMIDLAERTAWNQAWNTYYAGLATDGLIQIKDTTDADPTNWSATDDLGLLLDGKRASQVAVANAKEALARDQLDSDHDQYTELSSSQRSALQEYVEIHETRIKRFDDAIETIESDPVAATGVTIDDASVQGTKDADDLVEDYKAAVSTIQRERTVNFGEWRAQGSASNATRDSLQDPANLLEAPVNVAQSDLDRATARGDTGNALKAYQDALDAAKAAKKVYDDAGADTANPASALLRSLIAADDTGQALIDAVSDTYEVAKSGADAAQKIVDELTGEGGQVTQNTAAIATNATNIATNAENIAENATNIATNAENIATNAAGIMANSERLDAHEVLVTQNIADIATNAGNIASNTSMIGANTGAIAANASRIDANVTAIRELREDMSGGIAAAMALAGMPEIGDRGVAVGAGSYDGESAVAVGVHFSGENSRFKAAITSGGGETGVSIGGGWSF